MSMDRFSFVAALLITGGLVLTGGCKKQEVVETSIPAVVVEPAIEMEFADSVVEVGEVQAIETVDLSANVSGFLTEANFKEGDLVKKGTKLFQIDPAVYEAAVRKAEADVNKCQAQLTNAEVEYKRQKRLLESNATSRTEYDKAEMNLRTAQAELKYAEAGLAEKKVDLGYTQIVAPFDGYMSFKKYSVGNMVGSSSGPLATITKDGNVNIYFSIGELTMLKIFENYPDTKENEGISPAIRVILQNGREHKEKVWISGWNNMVQGGTIRIQAEAEDSQKMLVPGQYVKVHIQVSPRRKRVMVRQEAVLREQLGDFVHVVNAQNKIERRKVKLGMKNGDYQVIVSGLRAGECVVVEGLQKAGPGDEVKPVTAQQTASSVQAPSRPEQPEKAQQPEQPEKAGGSAASSPEQPNAAKK